MSLEAFGDTDEDMRGNPFDEMMDSLRATGQVWECRCGCTHCLVGKPCPDCNRSQEDGEV